MSDSILFWNEVALEANRISHTNGKMEQAGPTLSSRALAIVHLAMYDAYVAIDETEYPPYLPDLPHPPRGADPQAAVAGAAHRTLTALFPSQTSFFDARLKSLGCLDGPSFEFGRYVARAILLDREDDPDAGDTGYEPSPYPGRHRVDPDNPGQGFHGPFYGANSKGFAITARHTILPPPFKGKEKWHGGYLRALRQVRGKGIAPDLMGTLTRKFLKRTVEQSLIGLYWAYDGAAEIGTPPRLYNQIVRRIAIARGEPEARNARLFALVNVAMADAGILAWAEKYKYDFWRPILGIREHDYSMGPAAQYANNNISPNTDLGWLPFGAPATNSMRQYFAVEIAGAFPFNHAIVGRLKNFTPPFPSYPSGHAAFGAAAFHITRLFYGISYGHRGNDHLFDDLDLDFVSDELNGLNEDNRGTLRPRHLRNFPGGLWQMIEENARSRVYLGVHWIFDAFAVNKAGEMNLSRNIGGVPLGLKIAEDIYRHGMRKSTVGPCAPDVGYSWEFTAAPAAKAPPAQLPARARRGVRRPR